MARSVSRSEASGALAARRWPWVLICVATRVAIAQPSVTSPAAPPSPGYYIGALAEYDIDQRLLKPFLGLEGLLRLDDDLALHAVAGGGAFGQVDGPGGRFATLRIGIVNGICGGRERSCPVIGVDVGYELLRPDPYDTPVTADLAMVYSRIGWVVQRGLVQFGAVLIVEAGFGRDREQPITSQPPTTSWTGVAGVGLALGLGYSF
jgi:hypothetical protein